MGTKTAFTFPDGMLRESSTDLLYSYTHWFLPPRETLTTLQLGAGLARLYSSRKLSQTGILKGAVYLKTPLPP